VGAWSGKLYGLVQDLTPGDGAVDGLALGYADEQKQTDADGNLQKLTWQFQVSPTKPSRSQIALVQLPSGQMYCRALACNKVPLGGVPCHSDSLAKLR
jgi:hypothetical protein